MFYALEIALAFTPWMNWFLKHNVLLCMILILSMWGLLVCLHSVKSSVVVEGLPLVSDNVTERWITNASTLGVSLPVRYAPAGAIIVPGMSGEWLQSGS